MTQSNRTKTSLTFEQKVAAIQSLRNLGNSLWWRFNTHGFGARAWYCSAEQVDVSDGLIISGALGQGDTPELALDDYWTQLTVLEEGSRVVIDALRNTRRAVRWNGFMWEPFKEPSRVTK